MAVFKNQSLLIIKVQTNYVLSDAEVKKILFKKPDGMAGFWPANIEGTTVLTYQLANGDIDQSGRWTFQAYAEIGGLKTYGEINALIFEDNLEAVVAP